MRVLLLAYGSPGEVESLAGLAVRLWAHSAQWRVSAPPDCAERLAEGCDALMAGGVMSAGVWL